MSCENCVHTIGKPIYKQGDKVSFNVEYKGEMIICTGTVEIIDAYGTCEQNEEPSYDIMVEKWLDTNKPCLVKHIRESKINQEV